MGNTNSNDNVSVNNTQQTIQSKQALTPEQYKQMLKNKFFELNS